MAENISFASTNRKLNDYSDELENTYLHLTKITTRGGKKTYQFNWTIRDYVRIHRSLIYYAHHIRIGHTVHRLRLIKHSSRNRSTGLERIPNYILLGCTPRTSCAEVSFAIVTYDGQEVSPDNAWKGTVAHFVNRKHYSGFSETTAMFLDFLDLVAVCRITVDAQAKDVVEIVDCGSLSRDLERIFENGEFTDITIEVGEKQFKVHRAILATRSSVLSAMLKNDMRESAEKKLVIEDSEPEAVGEFLRYLYSGKTPLLNEELALNLLPLADKYDLPNLKEDVAHFLRCNMSVPHVLQTLIVADLHNVKFLRKEAIEFIADNLYELMRTEDWSDFRAHSELVDSILKYFS